MDNNTQRHYERELACRRGSTVEVVTVSTTGRDSAGELLTLNGELGEREGGTRNTIVRNQETSVLDQRTNKSQG